MNCTVEEKKRTTTTKNTNNKKREKREKREKRIEEKGNVSYMCS